MDPNLDNTSFYVMLFSLMILVGCFYFMYQKIRKINETIGQIQKHLMYQQNLIEKHNVLLRNTPTNMNPNEIIQDVHPPSFMNNETIKKEEKPPVEEKPNPIQTLLPMISSLMGMMNQGEEVEEEEEEEEVEERKTEMVKEIETELNELKKVDTNIPNEGRVEEEET